jgi:general secretion pathway protein J
MSVSRCRLLFLSISFRHELLPERSSRAEQSVRRPAAGGFTLLELLVVLVVLGFLMVGVTQGVRAGVTMWHAQLRHIGETAELDSAARVLRQLLTGIPASPENSSGNADAGTTIMAGTEDHFTFIGDLPTGLGTTQRADVTLELRRNRLVLLWAPHRHEIASGPAPELSEVELIRGVDRFDLAYRAPAVLNQPGGWVVKWDGPTPPELIRVRVRFAKDDPRHWPDLIAAAQM